MTPENVVVKKIPFLKIWTELPTIEELSGISEPTAGVMPEEYVIDFEHDKVIETMLRISDEERIPGFKFDIDSLYEVGPSRIIAYYEHVRYGRAVTETSIPIRAGESYNTSVHGLSGLLAAAQLLLIDAKRNIVSIDASRKKVAFNAIQRYRQVMLTVRQILTNYPTPANPGRLIVSTYTEIIKQAGQITEIPYICIDRDLLADYEAAGHTEQEAIDYWYQYKEQPTW